MQRNNVLEILKHATTTGNHLSLPSLCTSAIVLKLRFVGNKLALKFIPSGILATDPSEIPRTESWTGQDRSAKKENIN